MKVSNYPYEWMRFDADMLGWFRKHGNKYQKAS